MTWLVVNCGLTNLALRSFKTGLINEHGEFLNLQAEFLGSFRKLLIIGQQLTVSFHEGATAVRNLSHNNRHWIFRTLRYFFSRAALNIPRRHMCRRVSRSNLPPRNHDPPTVFDKHLDGITIHIGIKHIHDTAGENSHSARRFFCWLICFRHRSKHKVLRNSRHRFGQSVTNAEEDSS